MIYMSSNEEKMKELVKVSNNEVHAWVDYLNAKHNCEKHGDQKACKDAKLIQKSHNTDVTEYTDKVLK